MAAGDPYVFDDELAALSARASSLTARYGEIAPHDPVAGHRVLVELLGAIGAETAIRAPLYCDYGFNLRFGARAFANFGLVALDVAAITIGDDVQIGPNVQLLTPTHPIDPEPRRRKVESAEPITIGDNVWLGGGVIVLAGVTIGENTVVGAGAVVTKDLPANVVAVGNPAKVVRPL
ncbi:Maltose O-acetyltransferase [Actinoalloteichus hoggarensis]|uniref:Acetyltransferase n=2 Tax=Actinoalloteichus hoggarensis TaxID=1470176 RepID=A0A221VZ29_9PSEU|nr:Maltose O-acetyltransferase [Actinoalloteichus hoggarensis]